MAENYPVFLTASEVSAKALNRALLLLQDLENTEWEKHTSWCVLTTESVDQVAVPTFPHLTAPPTPNAFTGKSLQDITLFMRRNYDAMVEPANLVPHVWVVIDAKGMQEDNCIVCEQSLDEETGEVTDSFRGVRLPFEETWSLFANLSIANMGMEDWIDEDAGPQEDGVYKWSGFPGEDGPVENAKLKEKRNALLEKWKKDGFID
ncbi:hypothetical protein BP6252_07438 [Coleophoma cylindrospora]|uniref:DUF6924 domain-containing protein n=1 Tax=Coleophoma cylindrospora TaxID=1849047 RepID=A0A3D8RI60_9HELO|nr:hypothetical protein BP6252_07438 [Coleophoma cylindrospora]